jgi:hypothetical protein
MRRLEICALLMLGALAGCMTAAPMPGATTPELSAGGSAAGSGGGAAGGASRTATGGGGGGYAPLILDRTDTGLGSTVEFHHLPSAAELSDAAGLFAIRHVVVMLPSWPQVSADLSRFGALPPEADVIVIVPGYAPDRTALDAWNYSRGRLRLIVVVDGPPMSPLQLDDLNTLRPLERVVARMDQPSRAGFERLQRPLSFVTTVD